MTPKRLAEIEERFRVACVHLQDYPKTATEGPCFVNIGKPWQVNESLADISDLLVEVKRLQFAMKWFVLLKPNLWPNHD